MPEPNAATDRKPRRWLRQTTRWAGPILLVLLVGVGWHLWSRRPVAVSPRRIAPGVTYWAETVSLGGREADWVRVAEIDLTHPGIELHVTEPQANPQDPAFPYPLRFVGAQAAEAGLTVAINGTLFERTSRWYWPGTPAHPRETIVARGQVSHVHPHSFLMWFERDLTPHVVHRKPPPQQALAKAWWGISGQSLSLRNGRTMPHTLRGPPDRRTMIAVNLETRTLWLATFADAITGEAADYLNRHGATYALNLDGGGSTAFYLSPDTDAPRTGVLTHRWRPVPVIFGVRARPDAEAKPER